MRLFVAAELPEQMIEALAETSALLRETVRGRFVASDSFHVTLAFLGEVNSARVDDVIDAIEDACEPFDPFPVALGELGSFGKKASSTLWQGFRDTDDFCMLAKNVRSSLESGGFAFDSKAFKPHVTLMRAARLQGAVLPTPVFARGEVTQVSLFRSDLSGPRPVYEPLHTVFLGAR